MTILNEYNMGCISLTGSDYKVVAVNNSSENYRKCLSIIQELHYAQRKPQIKHLFALLKNDVIVGVASYGKPASHSLCIGVAGRERSHKVYELNRLITLDKTKNLLSRFVSTTLKMLKPYGYIIVSYSDTQMGHNGYVYQATNFIYTGRTKGRTDKYTPQGKHSRHYTDEFNHYRKYRSPKHRYVYFLDKKDAKYLKYPIEPYPKGNNRNYKLGERMKVKVLDKRNDQVFYE